MPSIYLNHVKVAEESGGVVSLPNTVQFNNLKIGGTEVINSNRQIQNITGLKIGETEVINSNRQIQNITGIDFGSGSVLNDYEEGTWTPKIYGNNVEITSPTVASGRYLKAGNLVYLSFYFYKATGSATPGSPGWQVRNMPFSGKYINGPSGGYQSLTAGYMFINSIIYDSHRWQANATDIFTLYGSAMARSWSSSLIEFHGYGSLVIND